MKKLSKENVQRIVDLGQRLTKNRENLDAECQRLEHLCLELGADEVYAVLLKRFDWLSRGTLDSMRAVGKRKFPVELLFNNRPNTSWMRRLPYEVSRRYLTEKLPVLISEDGIEKEAHYRYDEVPHGYRAQVFAHDHIRDFAQQRQYRIQKYSEFERGGQKRKTEPYVEGDYLVIPATRIKLKQSNRWCYKTMELVTKAIQNNFAARARQTAHPHAQGATRRLAA